MDNALSVFVFAGVQVFLSFGVVSLNVVCVLLLRHASTFPYNQKVCLINLNVVQVLFLITQNVILWMDIAGAESAFIECTWLFKLNAVVIPWSNIIFVLTVDRFVQVLLNIEHVTRDQNGRIIKVIILLCWFVGGLSFTVSAVADYQLNTSSFLIGQFFVTKAYQGIIFVTFACTYICVAYRANINKSDGDDEAGPRAIYTDPYNKNVPSSTSPPTNIHLSHSKHPIPFWIGLTYIFFVVVPSVSSFTISEGRFSKNTTRMSVVCMVAYDLNCFIVCIICMFMNNEMRKNVRDLITCSRKGESVHGHSHLQYASLIATKLRNIAGKPAEHELPKVRI